MDVLRVFVSVFIYIVSFSEKQKEIVFRLYKKIMYNDTLS